jgi:hypothetical protein
MRRADDGGVGPELAQEVSVVDEEGAVDSRGLLLAPVGIDVGDTDDVDRQSTQSFDVGLDDGRGATDERVPESR